MNISYPFIRRPVGTTLLAIGLFLAGAVAYDFLPVASVPAVDFPTIRVSASRPGADPETMAATIAAPLERRLGAISGVTEITSAQFARPDRHHHPVRPQPQHRQRRARRAGRAQRRAQRPAARSADVADIPQIQSGAGADHDPGADLEDRSHRARSTTPPIRSSRSASCRCQASPTCRSNGAEQPAIRVRINPVALASTGVSYDDVRLAISQTNAQGAARRVRWRRSARKRIATNDQLRTVADYQSLVVKIGQRQCHPARRCGVGRAGHPQYQFGRLVQSAAGGAAGHHQADQRQRHRNRRPHPRIAPGNQAVDPRRHRHQCAVRPHPDDPRQRPRHAGTRWRPPSCW